MHSSVEAPGAVVAKPTLSVCMPNYNHARYLPQALEALLCQSFRPTEIIVVDDGSTDGSVDVIEQYVRKDPIVRLFRNNRNQGVVSTSNRALALATGEYVSLLAADDFVLPSFLENSLNLLVQYPQAGLCSGMSRLIGEHGEDKGLVPIPTISSSNVFLDAKECLRAIRRHGSWILGNTVVHRRQMLVNAGGFIPELHSFCDGFIYLVIAARHGVCFIPEPLACWRRMETGYSWSTYVDFKLRLDIRDTVVNLMRTTYRDLFPGDFVDEWVRSYTASVGLTAHDQMRRERERLLTETFSRLLPIHSWRGRLFVGTVRFILRAESRAIYSLLCWVFEEFPDWVTKLWRLKKGASKDDSR
jgi:glycosyltransferase involved in cell wall biosynthesis